MENSQLIFNILFVSGIVFGLIFLVYITFFVRSRNFAQQCLVNFILFLTFNNIQILLVDNFTSQTDCYINNLHPFLFFVFVVPYFHSFIVYYLKIENQVFQYLKIAKIIFGIGMLARIILNPFFEYGNCYNIGTYVKIEEITIAAFSIFIFIKVIELIFYKSKLYAFVLSFDKLQWIKQFLVCGGLVLLFWVIAIVFNLQNVVYPKVFIYYPLRLSSTYLLYAVSYYGFYKNILTDDRIEIRTISKDLKLNTTIDFQDSKKEISSTMQLIINYINESNCYLDSGLNLDKLAALTKIDKKVISREISQSDKNNFNDLINFYRIERAKILLKDDSFKNFTNEAIGFECGFNTKSTFYLAFNKFTKKTPNDYRQKSFEN